MQQYWFSLAHFFLYKDSVVGSVFIRENTGERKHLFLHILRSVFCKAVRNNFNSSHRLYSAKKLFLKIM